MTLRYVTLDFYLLNYKEIDDELTILKMLSKAERIVDTLTFNRIRNLGIENCSEYETKIIKECVCEIANFYYNNDDYLNNYLKNYSINGVSMSFELNDRITEVGGVIIPNEIYQKLSLTRYTNPSYYY